MTQLANKYITYLNELVYTLDCMYLHGQAKDKLEGLHPPPLKAISWSVRWQLFYCSLFRLM